MMKSCVTLQISRTGQYRCRNLKQKTGEKVKNEVWWDKEKRNVSPELFLLACSIEWCLMLI